jgi:hypothetical protein
MKLTKKQRELAKDIKYIAELLRLTPDVSSVDRELWTVHLERAWRDLVISGVLGQYLWMDEMLNDVICGVLFPGSPSYPQLWRTKRFKAFNYYVLERIYLIQKADFVQATIRMPKKVHKDLLALNDLRNALAHSFFPENRRVKPGWKGANIFSRAGFDQFWADMAESTEFFVNRIRRANRRRAARRERPHQRG